MKMFNIDVKELLALKKSLRFGADGKFRLLVMSDLHAGIGFSEQTAIAVRRTVEAVRPDLVVFNGDTAGPGRIHVENKEQLREMLERLIPPIEELGVPWAQVFGNHDDSFGLANVDAQEVYDSYEFCVSKRGEKSLRGSGNFVLPVLSSSSDVPAAAIWGLDSHSGMKEFIEAYHLDPELRSVLPVPVAQGRGYDTVDVAQVFWYYMASAALEEYSGRKLPGILCCHIPVPEFELAARNMDATNLWGNLCENVASSELNSGLFRACLERGDVKAIVCGHDHVNDFCAEYCGIKLCYDAGMDYDAYQRDYLRGCRLFTLDENDPWAIKTRIVRVSEIMGEEGNNRRGDRLDPYA